MAARMRLRTLMIPVLILGATVAGFVLVARATAGGAVSAATSPHWLPRAAAFVLAGGGVLVAATLHHKIGKRLPKWADGFLASAAAPRVVLLKTLAILVATWGVRWMGVTLTLNAVGVHASVGAAFIYMTVTGL